MEIGMTVENNRIVAKIKVFGVGGAGCNTVNRMVASQMEGAEFYVANTDLQSLNNSPSPNKIPLGEKITGGRGAGSNPKIGKESALESENVIRELIKGADMVFVAAGMGGGTGTGAAPVFARIAKEEGALTVAFVTKPFDFESANRMRVALAGIEELKKCVDTLIVVPNNKLMEYNEELSLVEAFKLADAVLQQGIYSITALITHNNAQIALDFADVKTVMEGQGSALIGTGYATGDNKAIRAAEMAINSPLLETKITGAKKAIINVTGSKSMKLQEANQAVDYIRNAAGVEVDIIFGVIINEELDDRIIVTVIAAGFDDEAENDPPEYFSGGASENHETTNEKEAVDTPSFFDIRRSW